MVKFEIEGIDEKYQKHVVFVDADGKIRTGIVEYIKLIGQDCITDGVTVGTGTTSPKTYNGILCYPLPFPSNIVGNDYAEQTLSLTVAAGSSSSGTGSVSATFVSNLRNKITKVRGDVIAVVTYYYASSDTSGTVEVTTIDIEFGKIDTETGETTTIASKTLTINRSTTGSVTEAAVAIFENLDFSINEGERLYLSVTVNFSYIVTNSGTASITDTATVRIDYYRGADDTYIMIPVVM